MNCYSMNSMMAVGVMIVFGSVSNVVMGSFFEMKYGNYIGVYSSNVHGVTWSDAKEYCISTVGSNLASFHSSNDETEAFIAVSNVLNEYGVYNTYSAEIFYAWIGLSDSENEGSFVWSDETPNDYEFNWYPTQPNDFGHNEDCAHLTGPHSNFQGKWNDAPCHTSSLHAFVCNIPEVTVAQFGGGNNGIFGSVTVRDGSVSVDLDLSNFDFNTLPQSKEQCFSNGGLLFHMHERWDHLDDNDRFGSDLCSSEFTGGHYDPWLACGPATGNDFCRSQASGCVTGSNILGIESGSYVDNQYDCNPETFLFDNPYVCEVGDWSGKYGRLALNSNDNSLLLTGRSPFEVSGFDSRDMSVVFHCSDGERIFCAPFRLDYENSYYTSMPHLNERPRQEEIGRQGRVAYFDSGNHNFIKLTNSGEIFAEFNVNFFHLPNDCGDSLLYRIYNGDSEFYYNSYNDATNFYDITVSCDGDSDSVFCFNNGKLCGMRDESLFECDFDNDRFSCAPGDLSGKFGSFNFQHFQSFSLASEIDDLMIDLALLNGKFAVLQCSNTLDIVAAAQFVTF